ncbi:MAG: TolC family protein [Planctomycetaceae bacterium]
MSRSEADSPAEGCSTSLFLKLATRILKRSFVASLCSTLLLSGCSTTRKSTVSDLQYLLEPDCRVDDNRNYDTRISWPNLDNTTAQAVQSTIEPRSLSRRVEDEVREIQLSECFHIALSHNDIIETSALGGVGAKVVLTNPQGANSVYDAAIQETGILFGRRGLNAALSDFDTTFATGITWGRASGRNNLAATPLTLNTAETAAFRSSLTKAFASGGSIQFSHDWDYLGTNSPGAYYPSSYAGSIGAQIRQPLLAGSGTEFTRVAGPVNPSFGSIAGVSQGVVIARINQDITLADFETAVRNAMADIENAYWDLYLAYHSYDTAVVAHKSALETWRISNIAVEVGGNGKIGPVDELLAKDRVYETKASTETALNGIFRAESELRRLLGMPMNDGTVLRPVDEPSVAEFVPDWQGSLTKALTQRSELRRQKWQIKSLQLQLNAARSLVRPRLDAVASYDINGFGDKLLGQNTQDPVTGLPTRNGFGSMAHDDLESWTLGLQFSMPIGFRQAHSQVRNYELQLAKANAVLAAQERNIAHDVANAVQEISSTYTAAQSSLKRMKAAAERVEKYRIILEVGGSNREVDNSMDVVVRAQERLAAAEIAFYQQVSAYNKAITSLHVATGDLLEHNNIWLAEGAWNADAYCDAQAKSAARAYGIDNPKVDAHPPEFAVDHPVGTVELSPRVMPGNVISSPVPERPYEPVSPVEPAATTEP